MTSRLDRLFLLLDQGTSQITRKAAAIQLGEVQKLHPHELNNLLTKLRHYIHSSSWDTRIAAGLAVEAILKHVPQWKPQGVDDEDSKVNVDVKKHFTGRMTFETFDINTVISCGKDLLASEGTEYDMSVSSADTTEPGEFKEKLVLQRQLLNQRLGLNINQALSLGISSSEIVSNEDLSLHLEGSIKKEPPSTNNCQTRFENIIPKKRGITAPDGFTKRIKMEDDKDVAKTVVDFSSLKEWPLASFADELMNDLFNPSWEVRHGAATALREVVKQHGKCGGRILEGSSNQMDQLNQNWLEDLALRLFCVLALDKFGDFISDQVVAPVRETCAQTLGSIFGYMLDDNVQASVQILLQLLRRQEWEARHGGLLALKYLLAVREDLRSALLPLVFDPIFNALKDSVDDVSAVAASALIPVKESLLQTLSTKVPVVLDFLWNALLEIDELTSSTSNILMLLSSLLHGNCKDNLTHLRNLVPRLWPFLCHHLSDVRKSVLEALLILTAENISSLMDINTLSHCLRFLYQRCLTEPKDAIMKLLYCVWQNVVQNSDPQNLIAASSPFFSGWICLMMHPARIAIDSSTSPVWLEFKQVDHIVHKPHGKGEAGLSDSDKYMLAGNDTSDSQAERDRCVIRARLQAAKFIGLLTSVVTSVSSPETPSPLECLSNILLFHLSSKSAIQKLCSAWIIKEWSVFKKSSEFHLPEPLLLKCMECLQESIFFEEFSSSFARLQQETRDLLTALRQQGCTLDDNIYRPGIVYTFQQINNLITTDCHSAIATAKAKLKGKAVESLEEKRRSLSKNNDEILNLQDSFLITVSSSLAAALVSWGYLPEKLNPVVRPIMDSLKKEENEQLQMSSAIHLTKLLDLCCAKERSNSLPSPVPKIVKNLISFLCCSQESELPNSSPFVQSNIVKASSSGNGSSNDGNGTASPGTPLPDLSHTIIALYKMQKAAEKTSHMRRSNSVNAAKKNFEVTANEEICPENKDGMEKQNEIMKRGATAALKEIVRYFGSEIESRLPTLWEKLTLISKAVTNSGEVLREHEADLKSSLMVLEVVASDMHQDLHDHLIRFLPYIGNCLCSTSNIIRHLSARSLGMLSTVITESTMDFVVNNVLSMLNASDSEVQRQGAIEAIYYVIDRLGIGIVPYIVLLIVSVLGRMSDQNDDVRTLATHCFAQLVQLMPLDTGTSALNINKKLLEKKKEEQHFLDQLMNPKNLDDYKVAVPINAELRSYQQQGVNWLAFLNKYKLHGILCDEMGLGKTLMSLCVLASDHFYRADRYKKTRSPDSKPLPSLVICPPTLTGHWVYEVGKFVEPVYLNPLNYSGPPAERTRLRSKVKRQGNSEKKPFNLIIASYDIVRNDIDFFSSIHWNYCILDEGHIIKNGRTKLSKAIKSLSANHRVILTGTPIQNNVLELWSLFDFLIPGFLGTERQFMARYSKPILQSRDAKASSKEQEAGVLAMESLHRQVLPFILRRMKEDVLKDLPPKIMQDYYCDLSPLQSHLYEDFSKSRVRQNLETSLTDENNASNVNKTHIFQALQYLRKVCNHPKLVLTPQHPEYENVLRTLKEQNTSLSDISHAAKLCALKQLLLDCGIGCQSSNNLISETEPIVNQHRALIFCQLKGMLDILENDLFKQNMPSVTYLRLDGSISPASRHSVVHRFNNDPSIDVLLLTTQVGGLGLNLTGADTVIFVEHDWNPMKDLQAMDRAHRIGQKKVVNVYRLITTGTLEEKIMSLQKFKLTIANTVISQENAGLDTMRTDQLLDLFQINNQESQDDKSSSKSSRTAGMKSVLENLPELWDTEQYEKEYDLTSFVQSLRS